MPCVTREVKTPFHTVESNSYQLIFKIPNEKEYFPVTAVAVDLSYENHKAIIGRDFLQYCTLVYSGTDKSGYLLIKKKAEKNSALTYHFLCFLSYSSFVMSPSFNCSSEVTFFDNNQWYVF